MGCSTTPVASDQGSDCPIRGKDNDDIVEFPVSVTDTIETDGTLISASRSVLCDATGDHGDLRDCPRDADNPVLEAAGTIVIDSGEPLVCQSLIVGESDTAANDVSADLILTSEVGTYDGGMAISEEEIRLAVWQGCYGTSPVWIDLGQTEAPIDQTVRRKRRKCRYGFPHRTPEEKRNRIWQRLFPWNFYRTHL